MENKIINCLVVDDEIIIAETISSILKSLDFNVIKVCTDFNEAIDCLNNSKIDLAFLDINLNSEKSGIDIGLEIRKKHQMALIYITSYSDDETLNQIKPLNPEGFLLKPFNKEDIKMIANLAFNNFEIKKNLNNENLMTFKNADYIFVKFKDSYKKISVENIDYIQSQNVYLEIFHSEHKFIVRDTLKNFIQTLPNNFIQVHKSFVVNLKNITEFNYGFVKINEIEVPIGNNFREDFMSKIVLHK